MFYASRPILRVENNFLSRCCRCHYILYNRPRHHFIFANRSSSIIITVYRRPSPNFSRPDGEVLLAFAASSHSLPKFSRYSIYCAQLIYRQLFKFLLQIEWYFLCSRIYSFILTRIYRNKLSLFLISGMKNLRKNPNSKFQIPLRRAIYCRYIAIFFFFILQLSSSSVRCRFP